MNEALLRQLRHELRTPINHIVGFTELWLEEASDLDLPQLLSDLERIHSAGRQLLSLASQQLSEERADAGAIDLEGLGQDLRTPLSAIIGYTELLRDEATGRAPDTMLADMDKVRAAAVHLLSLVDTVGALERTEPTQASAEGMPLSDHGKTRPAPSTAVGAPEPSTLLVVDDNPINRDLLSRRLTRLGYVVRCAANGREALAGLAEGGIDLVLLDVMMPEMNGYEVLEYRQADPSLRDIPFVMLSALDELDSVVRCIEMGAEDYLLKPFNPVLLLARIEACVDKKRLRDREREHARLLAVERERSEQLLLNVLPGSIADRLKAGESLIADRFADVTALFSDLVGFTGLSLSVPPAEIVSMLNRIFSEFDALVEEQGVEKLKTSGDGYIVLAGVPAPRPDHAEAIADLALGMLKVIVRLRHETGWPLEIRIGIDTGGPVVAGIVGLSKFAYDVWGDTMNTASRMESHGLPGQIQVTENAFNRLRHAYRFKERGYITVKSKGQMRTYFLTGKQGDSFGDS